MAVVTIVLTVLRASVILFALLDAPPGCSEPASGMPGDGPRATDRILQPPDHAYGASVLRVLWFRLSGPPPRSGPNG
jgi:hypothetical protein